MINPPKLILLGVALSVLSGFSIPNCSAQNFPGQSLNQLLNQVDNSNWNSVPVSNPRQVLPAPRTGQMAQMPRSPYPSNPVQQFAPMGGMRQPLQSGPPPFSRQSLMRIFLEGGMGGGGSGPNPEDPSIKGNCEAQLQIARDQCAQAEGDAARTNYGSGYSKYDKQNAASSAQYHANAARAAADNAYSSSYGKSQSAQDYAAQARNAANQAQAAADRARYNADSAQ
ncbi:MAG: hypothetical protein K2X77_16405 [Candidatus Obscuribacterales bacterium]|nr:hypothetical protein [Candidatus Obscuribacterales bacterium]